MHTISTEVLRFYYRIVDNWGTRWQDQGITDCRMSRLTSISESRVIIKNIFHKTVTWQKKYILYCTNPECQDRMGLWHGSQDPALCRWPKIKIIQSYSGNAESKNNIKTDWNTSIIPSAHTHLSLSGRFNVRVALLTDDLINKAKRVGRNPGESLGAVVGEVAIWPPCTAKIWRTLNHHSSRSKRLWRCKQKVTVRLVSLLLINTFIQLNC